MYLHNDMNAFRLQSQMQNFFWINKTKHVEYSFEMVKKKKKDSLNVNVVAISFIRTSSLSKRQLLSPNCCNKVIYSLAREDLLVTNNTHELSQ